MWAQRQRDGEPVARCTVERLMWTADLRGVRRGYAGPAPRSPAPVPTAAATW
ncbi:hypothetical protein GB931_08305 [Modestobacter sp. I12A-02628]|uniref:Transposase n=1 Tax=Goekera deserti TaxID=2497753 RepID=A0A7K3WEY2_9ACTN|nr:hypothetical protein [Goekera deserti]NDI48570.1 hypothetical protein [Goekera deserti]NEL55051.1 transposase [Goekera deserti]